MALSAKADHFRKWVLATGILNIVAYTPLCFVFSLGMFLDTSATLNSALGLGGRGFTVPDNPNHLVMINIVGIFAVLLGAMLIIASLDIMNRAWFVFWEAVLRIIIFIYFLYFVLFGNAVYILLLFGAIDLIVGAVYLYYIFSIRELSIKFGR